MCIQPSKDHPGCDWLVDRMLTWVCKYASADKKKTDWLLHSLVSTQVLCTGSYSIYSGYHGYFGLNLF